jgi:hypothetical protein
MSQAIEALIHQSTVTSVAVAFHDQATCTEWLISADEPFHPASTIKIAIMAVEWLNTTIREATPILDL